jgi:hypothetical protein
MGCGDTSPRRSAITVISFSSDIFHESAKERKRESDGRRNAMDKRATPILIRPPRFVLSPFRAFVQNIGKAHDPASVQPVEEAGADQGKFDGTR